MSLLLAALGLMLVFEGLMPLVNPARWRALFTRLFTLSDGQLRFIGLLGVGIGLLILLIVT